MQDESLQRVVSRHVGGMDCQNLANLASGLRDLGPGGEGLRAQLQAAATDRLQQPPGGPRSHFSPEGLLALCLFLDAQDAGPPDELALLLRRAVRDALFSRRDRPVLEACLLRLGWTDCISELAS